MRLRTLILFDVLVVTSCWACSSPTAPATRPEPVSIHHGLPVTDDRGTLFFVCSTQPRLYCEANDTPSRCKSEVDHYIQRDPCPLKPIR